MIRFDGTQFEFDNPGGSLTFMIGSEKDGQRPLHWMADGRLASVDGAVRRGDLAGHRQLDFRLCGASFEGDHWHTLTGQVDERTANWEIFKAALLIPVIDPPPAPGMVLPAMSLRHRFKLGPRRGYHFLVEGGAVFLPTGEAALVVFGGTDATQGELQAVAQELTILEHLPLARVIVRVPRNSPDPIAAARALAQRCAGFDDLEPWPGRDPDYLPIGEPPSERHEDDMAVHFVTPWHRDQED